MSDELWRAENDYLAVTLYEDASGDIFEKRSGLHWRLGRVALQEDGPIDVGHVWLRTQRSLCEEYPGRFHGQRVGDSLRFTLLGRERKPKGQFTCSVRLDGPKLVMRITDIDEQLPSLVFPPPLEAESLVFPHNVGQWVRKPIPDLRFWVFPAHLNMRWFGGLRGAQSEHGWIAIVEEGYTDAGVLATGFKVSPGWLKSLGQWTPSRTISYQFVDNGYVGLAKTYRAYAIEHGLHRPLTEKLADTPALNNLLGGPLFSFMQAHTLRAERFEDRLETPPPAEELAEGNPKVMVTHAQVRQILEEALALGVPKALAVVRGWISGGYDETHPDVWPPEPALGTFDELKHLTTWSDPITVALHDNYQDIYEQSASWPSGVIRSRTGEPMAGGIWAGGQAYILNARDGLAYAKRNWQDIKTLETRAMFIDTTIAVQLYESYEPGNTLTRAQDEQYKLDLLRFYKEQGQVLGSEEGADFGVSLVDWIENRHHRIAGTSIPLWPLVFHDAVFNLRYGPAPVSAEGGSSAPRWLTNMLWGYPLLWGISPLSRYEFEGWDVRKNAILSLNHVNEWIERIGTAEMLSHRYLTSDGEVEETVFAPNIAVLVNFSAEAREVEGVTIPAHSYLIRD